MSTRFRFVVNLCVLFISVDCAAADLEWVRVSDDGKHFTFSESGNPFVPWGFNYDHDRNGQLLEDYWDDWPTVEADFGEMKQLGANVVRIHLQFGKFMESPTKARQHSLNQLARLVKLAEQTGLYLDLTGLGCYHKQDVPAWYDQLEEQQRWAAQAVFWEVVAQTCAASPAIFCYDLMNEPVVPGNKQRDDWLAGPFHDKYFVQFITLSANKRPRHEVAKKWTHNLVSAIRKHDQRHLITVGLVHWSLDRPGMTSGFNPKFIASELDFLAVHLYPEEGKVDEALETLAGFAAFDKPVVIEETFPLKCGIKTHAKFLDKSSTHVAGWIGFYWGKTPVEYRPPKNIAEAATLHWLELFQKRRSSILGLQAESNSFLSNGVTAHRGNSGEFPENTIVAFQSGIEVGADWIELDVFRTKDGKLVVIHDSTTERVGDQNLIVVESTYKQLLKVDVATEYRRQNGKNIAACPPQRIPLLEDVLQLIMKQSHTRVSIQPKMACVADAITLVKAMKAERWVGFNDGNLQYMAEVKRLAPEIRVFWDRGKNTNISDDIEIAKRHGFEALVLHYEGVTQEKIQKIKAARIEVGAWTVNDPDTMKRLLDLGVERIYTDYPSLLLSLLSR